MSQAESSRFDFLEIDTDAPAAEAEPVAAPAPRCKRCNAPSPVDAAGNCPVCVVAMRPRQVTDSTTPQQVAMSPRMERIYGWLTSKGCRLTPFSTDDMVASVLPRLQVLRAELVVAHIGINASGDTQAERDMLADLDSIMRRVPQARVGNGAATAESPVTVETKARVTAKDLVGVADAAGSTGTMTYWSLAGSVDVAKLQEAWEAEGLDADRLPVVPSPAVALHRACKAQASKHRMLRQHPEGGWVLVDERRQDGSLAYEVGTRVRLAATNEGEAAKILVTPPGGKDAPEELKVEAREVGARVRSAFDKIRGEVAAVDVSTWLVGLVSRLKGVALRETGGFYFIPKAQTEELAKVARALAVATGHTVYEIPVMQGTKTVAAVLDSLRREVAEVTAAIESELSQEIGARAARNRVNEVVELAEKIRGYETLLGVQLGEVVAKLGALRTKLESATTRFASLEVG